MGKSNKMTGTSNGKREDGKFRSKKVKHDPQAERGQCLVKKNKMAYKGCEN